MNRVLLGILATAIAGCAQPPPYQRSVEPAIFGAVDKAATQRREPSKFEPLEQAALPPLRMEMPAVRGQPIDQRFDLNVSNAPAAQVFMSIVSGTRYSMLMPPDLRGTISVSLKDVTIYEALDSLRELYGYEYKVDGTRIYVQPGGMQNRLFNVNYLPGQRRGNSDLRVQSGAVTDATPSAATGAPGLPVPAGTPGAPVAIASRSLEAARVTTQQSSDFWADLRNALVGIIGTADGRSVIVTPQSGVVSIRALPAELRAVENYLRATRLSVERQVMLEAKIVEVTLADGYQSGINWAAFRNSGPNVAVGQLSSSAATNTTTQLGTTGQILSSGTPPGGLVVNTAGRTALATASLALTSPAGALFGLAFQTSNFAALLSFLDSQGSTQVLSSPRIATINNQKAILKVGTDEFFVTNVTTTTTTTGTGATTAPSVTVQPFFSGIVLDVTPQIDDLGNIFLHVHPSVSEVTESVRTVNLGGGLPSISLPLAKSTVSETDTIVRVTDSNIVAIGGLMSVDLRDDRGGLPGMVEGLRNTNRTLKKKELVILLKPTIIHADRDWEQDLRDTRGRLESLGTLPAAAPKDARPQ